ncbi:hypothetical protein BFP76_04265 [Amylibacter kogurei]|uniref:diguanylate cyclase n=1 Tax=Paramylibacter kogurei TaxID=1889778 RepID=A0A2G5K4F1_9RHOB|nr:diguanylate cyclase [Amylibacter kogurei]PIB24427.1 hypothetical protein BFP76_04265 [Amylibacter kogurei]
MPGKILVADPIVTNRIALKMLLSKEYFDLCLIGCPDGICDTILKRRADVVLLSQRFATTTGYDVCRTIKSNPDTSDIPVIIINDTKPQNWVLAEDCGADDLISMALDKTYLIQRIRTLYRRKAELDASLIHLHAAELVGFSETTPSAFQHAKKNLNVHILDDGSLFCDQIAASLSRCKTKRVSINNTPTSLMKDIACADVIIIPFLDKLFRSDHAIVWKINALIKETAIPVLVVFEHANAQSHAMAVRLGLSEYSCGSENLARLGLRVQSIVHFTKRKSSTREILSNHVQEAKMDSLTGLYNRRYGMKYLSHLMHKPNAKTKPLAVMMLDLDNFKTLNDTHGHVIGDQILNELGDVLKNSVRSADMIMRIGGEEFLIMLPDCFLPTAQTIAQRILDKIRTVEFVSDKLEKRLHVTASIGIAIHDGRETKDSLISRADAALFQSKKHGRDQFHFCKV